MGYPINLTSADNFQLSAYVAEPTAPANARSKAGLVIIQEIFGVNPHIRRVTDSFAAEGFLSIAPALFDRVQPGVELPYTPDAGRQGYGFVTALDQKNTIADIDAAITYLRAQPGITKIAVVGFCWGGTLAYLSNARLSVDASVSYYPGGVNFYLEEKSKAPAIFHFGEHDDHIKKDVWAEVRAALPNAPVYTYDAGHGFNCDARESFNPKASTEAMTRTLAFLRQNLA